MHKKLAKMKIKPTLIFNNSTSNYSLTYEKNELTVPQYCIAYVKLCVTAYMWLGSCSTEDIDLMTSITESLIYK